MLLVRCKLCVADRVPNGNARGCGHSARHRSTRTHRVQVQAALLRAGVCRDLALCEAAVGNLAFRVAESLARQHVQTDACTVGAEGPDPIRGRAGIAK